MKAIEWLDNSVRFIDQTKLPFEEKYYQTNNYAEIADAISALRIRGAPLIGIAAAYGVALAAIHSQASEFSIFHYDLKHAIDVLARSRPTAVNLFWALQRMQKLLVHTSSVEDVKRLLLHEALSIHAEDVEMCKRIGENGARLIGNDFTILTICNTGALATGGEGTAQSVITTSHRQGKQISVYACETRPLLQGARLTTWELTKAGVHVTLISDNMAASLMSRKRVDCIITGADRIAANGDSANKIGTYMLAVLARYHSIPFYVAAPSSTIDVTIPNGAAIPIEERNEQEVRAVLGNPITLQTVPVWNPSFDVAPAELITAIITEQDVYRAPYHFA